MNNNADLIILLARHLAAGRLEHQKVIPVLKEICAGAEGGLSSQALIEALGRSDHPATASLRNEILRQVYRSAYDCYRRREAGDRVNLSEWTDLSHLPLPPLGWRDDGALVTAARRLAELARARNFLGTLPVGLPVFGDRIEKLYEEALTAFKALPGRWTHLLPSKEGFFWK
ncbi:MAG: hypothetical protein HY897_17995 [Deltaproteobacteria bacterium]|nr:hypothetical protein [Deltaproteobacteria bacterium]